MSEEPAHQGGGTQSTDVVVQLKGPYLKPPAYVTISFFMPIVAVSDIWKIFEWVHGSRNKRDALAHHAVSEWLDGVLADLRHLSELWAKIVEDVSRIGDDPRRISSVPPELLGMLNIQLATGERLKSFYYAAPRVLGGKTTVDYRESFLACLAQLVLIRQSGRRLVENLMKDRVEVRFLSPDNSTCDVSSIRGAGDAIQREIAALQVSIATFKATELTP